MGFFKSCITNKMILRDIFRKPQFVASSVVLRTLASSSSPGSGYAKKPLSILFKGVLRLSAGAEEPGIESEINSLKKKPVELEREIVEVKNSKSKKETATAKTVQLKSENANKTETKKSLSALFTGVEKKDLKNLGRKDDELVEEKPEAKVFRELPVETKMFVRLLHRKGYFGKANFLLMNGIGMECFANAYSRGNLMFAVEEFAVDHQDIAKSLSSSNLKKIALFGCPTLDRRAVFSAKALRRFLGIQENTVCHKCVLKDKCKLRYRVGKSDDENGLNLADLMRVIPRYGLHLVHPKLQIPDEIHASVNKLLEEVIYLSQTEPSSGLD